MIHIGIHTDNWRPLSVGFEGACEKIAATGLKHIEFCAIHGQSFIASLGYDPGVSLQSNPRACMTYLHQGGWDGVVSLGCSGTDENTRKSVEWMKGVVKGLGKKR